MKKLLTLLATVCFLSVSAQTEVPPSTPASKRLKSIEQRKELAAKSIVNEIEFQSIGPTVFSGRVADLAVSPTDPSHFYVAYASGGLWKTENNGTSFTPLFDHETVMTIGAIAVDWQNDAIWVGTGEVNSSRSSYAGVGIYKSTDGGKSWMHMGLPESHHIGRIILHPGDPQIAWVAALGHLYSPNPERGVYKTNDGGKTWQKTLFVNDNTGAVDLLIHPNNPGELYAATWHRERRAWNFVESAETSGIYRSTDGGKSWKLLSGPKSGFPNDDGVGRIGLAMHAEKNRTILYATVDNYNRRPKEEDEDEGLTKGDLRDMTREDFLELEKYEVQGFLNNNRFPKKYSADKVIKMIKREEITPKTLVEYLENPTSLYFDTPVIGLEVYRSEDNGKSWKKTHDDFIDGMYSSFGYYFGQVRVAPDDPDKIYCLGVPILRSDDGGKTFKSINGDNVHADHHALWINPDRPGHLILGNDGGINISYDDGEHWIKCNTPAVGQFYYIAVDMAQPYNVYGGLQDNGVWYGPHTYEAGSTDWHGSGRYPYQRIYGGDGMQIAIDTRNNTTVFTGSQFGNYVRLNLAKKEREFITPRHDLDERPFRWNWQTPIHLSVHNQDILYMGSHRLHRSFNQGDDFETISGDLTQGGKKGDVPYGTLTTIHESPLKFGLLYTGSDDGLMHVSKDAGNSWQLISQELPQGLWVARVIASQHEEGTVYAVLNGYRWDDFHPYLFKSENYGRSWQQLGSDLPMEPLNVVKEDPENDRILYVGSDHGVYVSLDGGQSFMAMNNELPAAPVHDLVVHPRDHHLLVGTHGRSIYRASVKELQLLTEELLAEELHVFDMEDVRYSGIWGNSSVSWREPTVPGVKIPVYVREPGEVKITILHEDQLQLYEFESECVQGLNFIEYDLSFEKAALQDYNKALNKERKKDEEPIEVKTADNGNSYLHKGKYAIVVKKGGSKGETELEVE